MCGIVTLLNTCLRSAAFVIPVFADSEAIGHVVLIGLEPCKPEQPNVAQEVEGKMYSLLCYEHSEGSLGVVWMQPETSLRPEKQTRALQKEWWRPS